eukprot:SAG31_NODE_21167_length_556_cov_0.982495_1_plen_41_part_01
MAAGEPRRTAAKRTKNDVAFSRLRKPICERLILGTEPGAKQ